MHPPQNERDQLERKPRLNQNDEQGSPAQNRAGLLSLWAEFFLVISTIEIPSS